MNYFHVGFVFEKPASQHKIDRIVDVLASSIAPDWCRYAENCWIIYTSLSADKLHIMLREALDKDDKFLIVPLDMQGARQGLMPKWVWAWLSIDRTHDGWWAVRDTILSPLLPPSPPPLPSLSEILGRLALTSGDDANK